MYLLSTTLLTFTFLFFTLISQCLALGSIELNLLSFRNDEGRLDDGSCCSDGTYQQKCSGPCKTFFRVCLKQFESKINVNSSCTFGEITTPVLGNNSIHLDRNSNQQVPGFNNPISFPFNFSWPGKFTIIVEAWHEAYYSSSAINQLGKKLIIRYSASRIQKVNVIPTDKYQRSNYTELVYSYRVICDANYYGEQCTVLCKPRDDSFGHYTCGQSTGERECLPGWTGKFCTEPVCSSGCSKEHGYCSKPDECRCRYGWSGSNCTMCERYPGCVNGECSKPWECKCKFGWGGLLCNQDLNYCATHSPCKNGVCSNAGPGSYKCNCPANFTGKNCEIEVSRCELNPCKNNGQCKALNGPQNYTCICPNGYFGKNCEFSNKQTDCTPNPCLNGGQCNDNPPTNNLDNSTYTCSCAPGYEGPRCELNVDECKLNPCSNGGTCIDQVNGFKCICAPGFTSKDCSVNINECESSPCLNGAECIDKVNEFECACKTGYFGSLCEHRMTSLEHKSKANKIRLSNSANQLPSTLESRQSAERLNSEQLIFISIISLIVPFIALLVFVSLRYLKKNNSLSNSKNSNNGLPCKSIEEVEVLRQNEANNLLNNSTTLNNNSNNFNASTKLSNTAPGVNVIVNSLNKGSVYSLSKAKSTMKLNNVNQLNNENIYTQYPVNNYAAQLRQQHSIYSTLNNVNRHSMYGMIGGYSKTLQTFNSPQEINLKPQPLYATTMKSQQHLNNNNYQLNNQVNNLHLNTNQSPKGIYESVQYGTYGQLKVEPNDVYASKQQALSVYNIPLSKQDKF